MRESFEQDAGYDVERYFALAESGLIGADDRVELLEGLIVAAPPQNPLHAGVVMRVDHSLRLAVGERASIRVHLPLLASGRSVPEPDVAVVPGGISDYDHCHPETALLVVEIADSSLPQDRLTKSRIYARAEIPEYWIVNLRSRCVEIHRDPDARRFLYRSVCTKVPGERIELAALPDAIVVVSDLLPSY